MAVNSLVDQQVKETMHDQLDNQPICIDFHKTLDGSRIIGLRPRGADWRQPAAQQFDFTAVVGSTA